VSGETPPAERFLLAAKNLMKRRFRLSISGPFRLKILACAAGLTLSAALAPAAPGNVYLVVGSDTAIWDGLDISRYRCHFGTGIYLLPDQAAAKAIDPAFRSRFTDSYGLPLKLTWWMMAGSVFRVADNTDVPLANTMPLHLMKQYHGATLRQLGDEIALHYHTFLWSDYNQDGVSYWNEAHTFLECQEDFALALAQVLLEEEEFPASFRSGWHYMDNEWQAALNLLLPFSLHNNSPNVSKDTVEPLQNVYDWSKATTRFVPYHPASTNYQLAGDGIGWNVRSVKMPNMSQAMMTAMFAQAAAGTDQVACLWAHLEETDFLTNIARIDTLAHVAATSHPEVSFRYCTAVEAMQRWLGASDQTPPRLDVTASLQADTVTLTITVDKPLFQPQPFVAVKDNFQQYSIVACASAGANAWTAVLPAPLSQLAKAGVAVTDPLGHVATRIIRFLPDDLYLDNLDPQYAEPAGAWTSTTNAAWGVDARLALLGAGDTARVRWSLPVSLSTAYNILVQVPAVTNAAGNVQFNITSAGTNVASFFFSSPLPPRQWFPLGTLFLDQTVENTLEMVASGSGQPGTFAVADVVRLSPLALPQPGFIQNVHVDVFDTTATITWATPAPATSLVEYGTGPGYGSFTVTNLLPVTSHVATLAGLIPGARYQFQIDSSAGALGYTSQGGFTTADFSVPVLVFDLTNVWRYTTNNLDADPAWKTRAYDDAAWPAGPGLLWVDTRAGGPNPAVQPRNTEMPTNLVTRLPFSTYYFRTHFALSEPLAGLAMTFSNYLDDGAVFYLNGVEIQRAFMPATAISNATLATSYKCTTGDATCPYVFTLSGALTTNLLAGDNVLAVEVHNFSANSPDITFGAALSYLVPSTPPPALKLLRSGNTTALYWNGSGFTLQWIDRLGVPAATWTNLAGPGPASPYTLTNPITGFYRLRQ
jgi:hypothetical protein